MKKILFCSLLGLFFMACKKDNSEIFPPLPPITNPDTVTTVDTIVTHDSFQVSGKLVACDIRPLTEGYVVVEVDGEIYEQFINGANFKFDVPNPNRALSFTIKAIDPNTTLEGLPQTFKITQEVRLENIIACDDNLQEYLRFTVNGEEKILPAEIIKVGDKELKITFDGSYLDFNLGASPGPISPGTYDQSNIPYFYFLESYPSIGHCTLECVAEGQACIEFHEFIFTQYTGLIGEEVSGSFSGIMDLINTFNTDITYPDLPFSAEFSASLR